MNNTEKNIFAFDANRIDSRRKVGTIKQIVGSFQMKLFAINAQTGEEITIDCLFRTKKEADEAFKYVDRCFRERNCGSYLYIK